MKRSLLALLFLVIATQAHATVYWYSPTGSNANACGSVDGDADPTLYRALDQTGLSCLSAGDTARLKVGTYDVTLRKTWIPSGSSTNTPTTVECETVVNPTADNGTRPSCAIAPTVSTYVLNFTDTGTRQDIRFRYIRFTLSAIITPTGNPSIVSVNNGTITRFTIENCELDNQDGGVPADNGAVFSGRSWVPGLVLRNNWVHHMLNGTNDPTGATGFYLASDDMTVEHNLIHNIGHHAMQLYSSGGVIFYRAIVRFNRIFSTGAGGIVLETTARDAQIYGNVSYSNSTSYSIKGLTTLFYNNVANGSTTGISCVSNCSTAASVLRNNISLGNTTNCSVGSSTNSNNTCTGTDTDYFIDPDNATLASRNYNLLETAPAGIADGVITGLPSGYTCVATGGTVCDRGAYQAPVRSTASVEDATDTIYRISFSLPTQSTRDGVGLQTCTVANIAITVAGAGATESSCSTSASTSRVDVTLGAAVTVGQALTDAYTRTSLPTLKDNVNIGGTYAHVRTYSATAGTNNVDGGALPAFTQTHFRCHFLNGTEASPSNHAAEDTNCTLPRGAAFRLRVKFKTDDDPAATTFVLRYSKDAGAYTAIPDTVGADLISWYGTIGASDIPSTGTATTELLTSDEATNVACAVVRTSSDYPTLDFNNGETECEYVLQISNSVAIGTTYDFRVYKSDGTALDTYTVTPRVTIGSYVMGSGA